ncbi:MAG: CRTAC1 family protein [Planctomycetaceae bacterium]|nr:CRTAC1 family protein [Planctomycetaceae bacterium]
MSKRRSIAVVGFIVVAVGVGFGVYRFLDKPTAAPTPLTPGTPHLRAAVEVPTVRFTDVTRESGVAFRHENGAFGKKLLPETMGGGVACFDYDGDGKPDMLFVGGRNWPGSTNEKQPPSLKLYRNTGNFTFEDATEVAGLGNVVIYGMGVAVGDFDNDGRPDFFVSCVGRHRLFRNLDGKRFEDVTDVASVGGPGQLPDVNAEQFLAWKPPIPFGSSCTFLDYDSDGRLDLFVCHYVTWSPASDLSITSTVTGATRTYQQPQQLDGAQCALYRNLDGTRFEDVSAKAKVLVSDKEGTDANARQRPVAKALGVVACDADSDGWPDLVVANDTVRNFFFHNQPGPDGTREFKEVGYPIGVGYPDNGTPRGGMGIDWGEFSPRRPAIVIANFANEPLTFLDRDRPGRLLFSDAAQSTGLAGPSRAALKFGTCFFDYDNDGCLDLLVCNGHIEPEIAKIQASQSYAQPPLLFWNTGNPECYFEPVTAAKGGDDLFRPLVGRGCAVADFDGDGDQDIVLVANGGDARLLRNDAPRENQFLRFNLRGDGVTSNRSAIGAVVTIEAGGKAFTRDVAGARGYLSHPELVVHVGLGTAVKADKVTVRWPGKTAIPQTWENLEAGKTHILTQGGK